MAKNKNGNELGKGIRQRKDGKYEARAIVNGQSIDIYGSNLAKVKQEFAEAKAKVNGDYASIYKNATLNEWYTFWMDTFKARTIKISSVAPMKNIYKNTFGRIIGMRKIRTICNIDIQKVVNQLQDEGKAYTTIKDALGRTRDAMESAKNNGVIPMNPCFDVILPPNPAGQKEIIFLKVNEQDVFLDYAEENWYKEMLHVMFDTGLRVGEVGALTWDDVDFEKRRIHVRQSLCSQYDHGEKMLKIQTPKTVNSYRTIPMFGDCYDMLVAQKEKIEHLRSDIGDRARNKEPEFQNLVFMTTMWTPCTRYIVESTIKRIVRDIDKARTMDAIENGTPYLAFPRVHPHAIRHTFCTRCFEKGIPVKQVQKLMGHSHYSTTLDIYTHVSDDSMDELVEKWG